MKHPRPTFDARSLLRIPFLRFSLLILLCVPGVGPGAHADVVLDWNELMIEAIRSDNSGPTLSSRNLAILHTAIYDGVNSVTRTHDPYRIQLEAPPGALVEAVVVGAACEVMNGLYPPFQSKSEKLCERFKAAGLALNDKLLEESLAFGTWIGKLSLQARTADGAMAETPYIPGTAPGRWRRTPPFFRPPLAPHWRRVTPFCLPDVATFLPPPPPSLDSLEYAESLNQVKSLGRKNGGPRTEEQTQIAVFWSDFSYTSMPPGHWHLIAASLSKTRKLAVQENARFFALLSLAQADTAIVCWEVKYRHDYWRPVTAIQRADEDNNSATEREAAWESQLSSPPFPAYISGHSSFSAASAEVLAGFFGSNDIPFSVSSDSLPGVTRSFTSFSACADEVGMSRVYGGIHFSFDNEQGKVCGKKIGDYVVKNFLQLQSGKKVEVSAKR